MGGWSRRALNSLSGAKAPAAPPSTPVADGVLQGPFERRNGLCWVADLPEQYVAPSDADDAPVASRLCLIEDDRSLGPRHSQHGTIEREGGGRYSHWKGKVFFSTRDGSDPDTNGRAYRVELGTPTPQMLAFGSCHLHGAIDNLELRGLAYSVRRTPYLTFTPREALQLIEFDLGLRQIPENFQPYAVPRDARTTLPTAADTADILILEFTQAIDVVYGSFGIMRRAVVHNILHPVRALGKSEGRIATRWYENGLIKCNEAVRSETAAQLLTLLPRTDVDQALARDIVLNARGSMQNADEVAATIVQIQERLRAKHVNVISAPNMYMPDGRPVPFPANFPKELEGLCAELGLPLLSLAQLVAAHGGRSAIKEDLYHFTPEFMGLLADEILAMSRRTLGHR